GLADQRARVHGVLVPARSDAAQRIGGNAVRDQHQETRARRRGRADFAERVAIGVVSGGATLWGLTLERVANLLPLLGARRGERRQSDGGPTLDAGLSVVRNVRIERDAERGIPGHAVDGVEHGAARDRPLGATPAGRALIHRPAGIYQELQRRRCHLRTRTLPRAHLPVEARLRVVLPLAFTEDDTAETF